MIDWMGQYWLSELLTAALILSVQLVYKSANKIKALKAQIAERNAELEKIGKEKHSALDHITKSYNNEIQKTEWKLEKSEEFHKGFKEIAIFLAGELDKIDPGWFERRRAAAKPPSELGG